jgi:amino acid transporter
MASYGQDFGAGGPYEVKNTGYVATDEEKNHYDVGPRHPSIVGSVKAVTDQTHRTLKSRHIQLIGIGGTIGTALYVQIGRGLMNGGPGSLFLLLSFASRSCSRRWKTLSSGSWSAIGSLVA